MQDSSPCINVGNMGIDNFEFPEFDLAGNNRVVGSTIDIGAYESNYVSINNNIVDEKQFSLSNNYPNPFNPETKINYELGGTLATNGLTNYELAEIIVYNTMGQSVWSTPVGAKNLLPGTATTNNHGSIQFDGSKFNSGVYYYSLIVDGMRIDTKSMILLK